MSITLLIVPMVSTLYSSIYWYNSEGFTRLLLTQPTQRSRIYLCRWAALSIALSGAFVVGCTFPLVFESAIDGASCLLLFLGMILAFIFVAIGMLTSVFVADRMTGIGLAFSAWFYFSIVHDSLVFIAQSTFHDYPMEIPSMILTAVNPIDLVRMTLLMKMNFSALMGYTGTVLQKSLSGVQGYALIIGTLMLWLCVPTVIGMRLFRRRDL
jgi:Cu-processing system permease protein